MNASGEWSGEYRYDSGSPGPTPFKLNLKQDWLGRISGTVQDGQADMPEVGAVVGWVRGARLRFRKMMPVFRVTAGAGTVPLSEYLAASGELRVAPDTPHPAVVYTGIVAADGKSVSGLWRVSTSVVRLADQQRALQFPAYSGSWVAKRSDAK